MQQDIGQIRQHDDKVNLFEIIGILLKSKKIIIITTLVITIATFLYSLQRLPTYQSSVLIEIGYYESHNLTKKLIEQPDSLVEDLNINLKLKSGNDLSSSIIYVKENKLIEIQHLSKSPEINIDSLNQFLNYLDTKHSLLANSIYLEKKAGLTQELDYINSEIEKFENLERLKISSLIQDLEFKIPYFDLQISNFKKIITEDEENLRLLKVSPDLYLERSKINPTLNQVIHEYKQELVDLTLRKENAILLKANSKERLNLLENKQLPIEPIEQFSQLLQEKNELEIKLREIENQNFHKTQTIGEITTSKLDSHNTLIRVLGLISGLITGIFLALGINLVKTYRESKA